MAKGGRGNKNISVMGGGKVSAPIKNNADTILGKNANVPTKDDILSGNATYGGLPVEYSNNLGHGGADAENLTDRILVSDKFFEHPKDIQRHILNHEIAHNLSDEMITENAGNFRAFSSVFLQEKKVPETAPAYKEGKRTYIEGLYGDMGANAIHETTTRAITEYLDDPQRLKNRSKKAYNVVNKFMKNR